MAGTTMHRSKGSIQDRFAAACHVATFTRASALFNFNDSFVFGVMTLPGTCFTVFAREWFVMPDRSLPD